MVLTVPMPKVSISWPSLFSASSTLSLISLLATMVSKLNPSEGAVRMCFIRQGY